MNKINNMKRFFLATIVFLFLSVDFHGFQDQPPKSLTQIDMRGRLVQSRTRLSDNFLVFQNCKTVQVNFVRTLGLLDVAIFYSDTIVYKNKVNAVGGTKLAIEIGNWINGKYIITVCDGIKNCANGEFTIKTGNENVPQGHNIGRKRTFPCAAASRRDAMY